MDRVLTILLEIDSLLGEVEPDIKPSERRGDLWFRAPEPKSREAVTRLLAAIERLAPAGSTYVGQTREFRATDGKMVVWLVGILRALRADYEAGYMRTVEELVHADLFADFLEMADELLSKGYKDPAAVIAGSVLEEHLRKLAGKHDVAVEHAGRPKKADALNIELVKADAYNKLDQKSVTAWLDLRNNAAHGHYDRYDKAQVEALVRDLRGFMARHPA